MSIFLPITNDKYTWFYYLGIIFFITHFAMYGISLDISYFGIILIGIGLGKPALSNWFTNLLWILIVIDIYATIKSIKKKMSMGKVKVKPQEDKSIE